jgi:hypothetical protein
MNYAFRLNDRLVRYNHVTLYRGHEIGIYSYYTKGVLTWMAHVDGQTVGYYESLGAAIDAAQKKIDSYELRPLEND